MEYAVNAIHADDIQELRFIKAKPNFTDNPQLFRIYHVGKAMDGKFTVKAQHISYDLSGKLITSGSAASCVAACALLEAQAGNFTIATDKSVTAPFSVSEPSSVRSWFGGKAGSLLDVYGGEWHYDNYTATLKQARGQDRGVQLRYGKNLTKLEQTVDTENLCTGIVPYYIDQDGNKTVGAYISTGLTLDVTRDRAIDFSPDVNPDSATPILTQLANLGASYVANNNLTSPVKSITLDFVQLSTLEERVDLCDTVHIFFEALGINASLKCIETVWDVLEERYTSCTFGTARTNIADTFTTVQKELAKAASRSFAAEAAKHASDMISGNLGGYVVFHDSDNNGEPDEILIMDTDSISTCQNIWRWNQNGLGFSSNGYAGPYSTLALTADGKIVADAITTGTLNADLIKAGVIEDVNHNSTIDMTSGVATLKNMKAKDTFLLIDDNNIVRARVGYLVNEGSSVRIQNTSGKVLCTMEEGLSGGYIAVGEHNGVQTGALGASSAGGSLSLKNSSGTVIGEIFTASNDDGYLDLRDSSNQQTIYMKGHTGIIVCNKIKARNGVEELYSGSLSSGNTTFNYGDYNLYIVSGIVRSGGSNITMTIPKAMLTGTDQSFCIADESDYITFKMKYSGTTATLTFGSRSSSGEICLVYGVN